MIDGADEVCRVLSSRCTLAVVSNGLPEIQKPRIRLSSLGQYIPQDRVFVAEEVGYRKPDPGIFEHVFRAFGIDTCWFDRSGLGSPGDIRPTFTVKTLAEVIGLV